MRALAQYIGSNVAAKSLKRLRHKQTGNNAAGQLAGQCTLHNHTLGSLRSLYNFTENECASFLSNGYPCIESLHATSFY